MVGAVFGLFWALAAGPAFSAERVDLSCPQHKIGAKGDPKWVGKILESQPVCVKHGELINKTRREHVELVKRMNEAAKKYSAAAVAKGNDTVSQLQAAKTMLESTAKEFREIAGEADQAAKKLDDGRKSNGQFVKALFTRHAELKHELEFQRRQLNQYQEGTRALFINNRDGQNTAKIEQRKREFDKKMAEMKPLIEVVEKEYHPHARQDQSLVVKTSEILSQELKSVRDNNLAKAKQVEEQASQIHPEALNSTAEGEKFKAAAEKGEKLPLAELKDAKPEQKGFWQSTKDSLAERFSGEKLPISKEVDERESMLREMIHGEAQEHGPESATEGSADKPVKSIFDEKPDSTYAKQAELGGDKLKQYASTDKGTVQENMVSTMEKANAGVEAQHQRDLAKDGGYKGLAEEVSGPVAETLDAHDRDVAAASRKLADTAKYETDPIGNMQVTEDPQARAELEAKVKARNDYVAGICSDTAKCQVLKDNDVPLVRSSSSYDGASGDGDRLRNISENARPAAYSDLNTGYLQEAPKDDRPKAERDADVLQSQHEERVTAMKGRLDDLKTEVAGQKALEERQEARVAGARATGGEISHDRMRDLLTNEKEIIAGEPAIAGAVAAKSDDLETKNLTRSAFEHQANKDFAWETSSMAGGPMSAVSAYKEMKTAESTSNLLPGDVEAATIHSEAKSKFKTEVVMATGGALLTAGTGSVVVGAAKETARTLALEGKAVSVFGGEGYSTPTRYFTKEVSEELSAAPKGISYDTLTSEPSVKYSQAPDESYYSAVTAREKSYDPIENSIPAETRAAEAEPPAPAREVERQAPVSHAETEPVHMPAEASAPPPARVAEEAPVRRVASRDYEPTPEAPRPAPVREAAAPAPVVRRAAEEAPPVPAPRVPSFAPPAPSAAPTPMARVANASHISAAAPINSIAPAAAAGGSAAARSIQVESVITRETAHRAVTREAHAAVEAVRPVEFTKIGPKSNPVRRTPAQPASSVAGAAEESAARSVPANSGSFGRQSSSAPAASGLAEERAAEARELAVINREHPASSVEMPTGGSSPGRAHGYDSSSSLRSRVDDIEEGGSVERAIADDAGHEIEKEVPAKAYNEAGTAAPSAKKMDAEADEILDEIEDGKSPAKPAAQGPRKLAAVPADRPSRNVKELLGRVRENYDVRTSKLDLDATSRGKWIRDKHEIKIREDLFDTDQVAVGKGTVVHESTHMTTDLKNVLERKTTFTSETKRVYGDKKLGRYSSRVRADEVDARIKQAASLRLDRLRAEGELAKTKNPFTKRRLRAKIAEISQAEGKVVERARQMIARERQLTEGALKQVDNPVASLPISKPKQVDGLDRFTYTFKDQAGATHVYQDLIPQFKELDAKGASRERQLAIYSSVKEKFGEGSEATSRFLESNAEKNGPTLTLKRDVVPAKEVRTYSVSTGVDDVQLNGFLDPAKPASRREVEQSLFKRLDQLDAREAHLEKHYGAAKKEYDFGPSGADARAAKTTRRGEHGPDEELDLIEADEAALAKADGPRPWSEETVKAKQSPYAERMSSVYQVENAPARAPAAVRDSTPKNKFLTEEHAQFQAIGPRDNEKFMELAKAANAGEPTAVKRAATLQAAVAKTLNDVVIKNKDRVNQVFNLQKDLIWNKISKDDLLSKHLVGQYSDFNTVKLAFDSADKQIDQKLTAIFTEYNQRYANYLDSVAKAEGWDKKAMGLAGKRENWHHLGIGATPDEANLAARKSREMLDENGLARPRTYEEVKGAVQDDLAAIEKRRVELENKFGETEGLFVGEGGERVLSAEASEAIRKAEQTDVGVKKALESQFSTKLTDSEVTAFRDYVAKADSFSPDLYVAERVDVPLDARRNGIVSADFKGQNARNLEETMKAMAGNRGKPVEEQVRAIRSGEEEATRALEAKKADFKRAVREQFGKADPDWEKHVYFTGDDGIYLPAKKLAAEDKAAFASRFSDTPDNLRLTFGQSHFVDSGKAIPRDALAGQRALSDFVVDAEKTEKDLRKGLMAKFQRDVTNNTQLVVDSVPRSDGTRSIGLYLGGKHTPEQMQKIRAWTQKYLRGRGDDLSFVKTLGEPGKNAKNLVADAISASKLEPERLGRAEAVLGRKLDQEQSRAVMNAHLVGEGQAGADGAAAKIGNYTRDQLAEKARILDQAGFTVAERRKLMENGIVGTEAGVQGKTGERVMVPRSAGGYSPGKIVGSTADGRMVVEFADGSKVIDKSRLKPVGAKSTVIEKVGREVEITPLLKNERPQLLVFEQNRSYTPFKSEPDFKLYSFQTEKGHSFEGPDGRKWTFKSFDPDTGMVTYSSGAKTTSWQTGTYHGHMYNVRIPSLQKDINLAIPALKGGRVDTATLARVQKVISKLPATGIENVNLIQVYKYRNTADKYWEKEYKMSNFVSAATAGNRTISLFPAGNGMGVVNIFRHELGHLIAEKTYGSSMPDKVWEAAMKADGKSVSRYAKASLAEDYAETVMEYLHKDAGLTDYTLFSPGHQKYAERFKILDEYFGVHPEEKRRVADMYRNVARITVGGSTAAVLYLGGSQMWGTYSAAPEVSTIDRQPTGR